MAWLTASWLEVIDEFRSIEAWFSGNESLVPRYEAAINALGSDDPDAWFAECAKAGISDESIAHFRNHWIGGDMFPWVDPDRVWARMQDGFRAALETAREHELPVSIAWVALDGTDPGFFDVGHAAGANAVTIVIATPRPQLATQT